MRSAVANNVRLPADLALQLRVIRKIYPAARIVRTPDCDGSGWRRGLGCVAQAAEDCGQALGL